MIQDINLQVYQMRKNGYTFAEIADALNCNDEDIRNIDDVNQANLDALPKSPFEDKPSINDETKKVVFQIEFKDLTLELRKLDDPHITFYRSTGIIEVETNKRNFIFNLNSILFIKYDPEECVIYYK